MRSLDETGAGGSAGCPHGAFCPLNRVRAGSAVRIRVLTTDEPISRRLRELGFCENRMVRLINSHSTVVCLVCEARLAISAELAERILVEPLAA